MLYVINRNLITEIPRILVVKIWYYTTCNFKTYYKFSESSHNAHAHTGQNICEIKNCYVHQLTCMIYTSLVVFNLINRITKLFTFCLAAAMQIAHSQMSNAHG
jgi:hypothetical protein